MFPPLVHWQCAENMELQKKVDRLEQPLASSIVHKSYSSSEQGVSEDYIDELKKKVQSQVLIRIFLLLNRQTFVQNLYFS